MAPKILVVRKMSSLEYYYSGAHRSEELQKSHEEQNQTLQKILEQIEKNNAPYQVITRKDLTEALVQNYDLLVSAGGDGTAIAVAAFNKDIPQLNLKTDARSKGHLCCQDPIQALDDFFNGDYQTEEWTRQAVYLDGNLIGRALNETAVGEGMKFTKMARYDIETDQKTEPHKNSGLIIATGTGSTGWPNAFEAFPRGSKTFKFLTVLPFEGQERGEGTNFKINYHGHEGKVALDTLEYDLPRDTVLEIKLSKNPLKVIKPKNGK